MSPAVGSGGGGSPKEGASARVGLPSGCPATGISVLGPQPTKTISRKSLACMDCAPGRSGNDDDVVDPADAGAGRIGVRGVPRVPDWQRAEGRASAGVAGAGRLRAP